MCRASIGREENGILPSRDFLEEHGIDDGSAGLCRHPATPSRKTLRRIHGGGRGDSSVVVPMGNADFTFGLRAGEMAGEAPAEKKENGS